MIYNYLRRPATQAERRMNADPEVAEFVRPKRRWRNLPDEWDDRPVSIWKNKWDRRRCA